MAQILGQLGAAPMMLALLYAAAFLHTLAKLRMLNGLSRSLDTKKLFAMSVLLSCLTRTMGFMTIGALNIYSIRLGKSGSSNSWERDDPDQLFYEKTMMVLFDLPDFMIVSAYTLLAVVWAEAFLQSRRHWLSARVYKRQLLLGYMVFNAALYGGQLVLYLLLFLPSFSKSGVLAVIYLFLTSVNMLVPLLLLVLLSYLTCIFSGFPYKSEVAMLRMRRVGRVVLLWTVTRITWSVTALTAVLEYNILVGSATTLHEQVTSILVVTLFLATELYPFVSALDNDVLLAMSADEVVPVRGDASGRPERRGGGRLAVEREGTLGDHNRLGRGRLTTLVSALSASAVDNTTQPLLPRGSETHSWQSLSSGSDLERTITPNGQSSYLAVENGAARECGRKGLPKREMVEKEDSCGSET